jgi:penicillin amidase
MIGYLTLAQSQGEMERFFLELVQAGVDEERLHELFPGILGELDVELLKKIRLQERIVSPESLWNIAPPLMMASNNWVVSGGKTRSGKPILANDPHLEVNRLPNVWYEIAMTAGGRYAIGATMPGVPAVLVGRTPDLAWGATYTFMDATDSWVEKCANGSCWREDEGWRPFRHRKEVIKRRKKAPLEKIFYENDHGVLEGDPYQEGFCLSTAWAPSSSGARTYNSFLEMWEARNVEEGMALLKNVESSWNFVLADKEGNIGYQMSGLMPKRRSGVSGFLPLAGWEKKNDWQGFVNPDDLPASLNPASGYFVTSNQNLNMFGKAAAINVGMGPYRSDRIGRLLDGDSSHTKESMYAAQRDLFSMQAESFMNILRPLLDDSKNADILKNWDLRYAADSEGASYFDLFYRGLYADVFGRHGIGVHAAEHLSRHTGIFNDFYINFDRILLSERSRWFGGRTREDLYRRAVSEILKDPPVPWGEKRKLLLKNILFGGKLPAFLGFDRGPVVLEGSLATPQQGQIFESAGRQTSFAPSLRMVADFADDDIYTSLAGGPSDRRFSHWYCSELENWKKGRYKRVSVAPAQKKLPF